MDKRSSDCHRLLLVRLYSFASTHLPDMILLYFRFSFWNFFFNQLFLKALRAFYCDEVLYVHY